MATTRPLWTDNSLTQLRRALYLAQRGLGDGQAVERSPGTYVKRRARRKVTRSVFRLFK